MLDSLDFEFSSVAPLLLSASRQFASETAKHEYVYSLDRKQRRDESREAEFIDADAKHSACAIGSIVCAYSYIEAIVNSAIHQSAMERQLDCKMAFSKRSERVYDSMVSGKGPFASSDPWKKADALLENHLELPRLDRECSAFKRADTLRKLRHTLIHASPLWKVRTTLTEKKSPRADENEKIATALIEYEVEPLLYYKYSFPRKFLNHSCASWAVKTASGFEEYFTSKLGFEVDFKTTSFRTI